MCPSARNFEIKTEQFYFKVICRFIFQIINEKPFRAHTDPSFKRFVLVNFGSKICKPEYIEVYSISISMT